MNSSLTTCWNIHVFVLCSPIHLIYTREKATIYFQCSYLYCRWHLIRLPFCPQTTGYWVGFLVWNWHYSHNTVATVIWYRCSLLSCALGTDLRDVCNNAVCVKIFYYAFLHFKKLHWSMEVYKAFHEIAGICPRECSANLFANILDEWKGRVWMPQSRCWEIYRRAVGPKQYLKGSLL